MTLPTDNEPLQVLIARIAAGESIDLDTIPSELRETPELQRLLQFVRVVGALDSNTSTVAAADAAPAQIGPWRLVRLLGTGGMGEVWLGERADGTVEHRVAIKRVHVNAAHFRQRLTAERRILARLEHPNIARFLDAGVDARGAPWLALEYVDGGAISDWCTQQALSLRARLQLFQKVCAAVEYAHRHLVVHRDLKPSNVMVNADGEPKLLDFGIAKLLDGSTSETTAAALTLAYAAPEQLRGEEISTATDVYALGLLLFRLLAGTLPDTRSVDNAAAVLARLANEETQRPSLRASRVAPSLPYPSAALKGDLDAIVAQAIRAQPAARYGSVAEFSADIGRYLASRPVRARAPTHWYRFKRFAWRNRMAMAFGILAALALIVGSVVSLQQAQRAAREAKSARSELARAEQISDFLASLYREQDPLSRGAADIRSPQMVLADAVARVGRELGSDTRSSARLLRVLGEAQLNLGEIVAARTTLNLAATQAKASADGLLGADIDAIRGTVALREMRQDDAARLFAGALAAAVAARGVDSVEAARIEARQALSLVALGRFKEALAAADRAQHVLEQRLGAEHQESSAAKVTLGLIQEQLRDDAAAKATLTAAISAIEAGFGAHDARLIMPLQTLGEVLRHLRDFAAARAALLRSADIARAQFGAHNNALSSILVRLAGVERDAGELEHAISVLDEAEAALIDSEDSAARAQLLSSRGSIRIELGDGLRAEADYREALRLHREAGKRRTGLDWFTQAQVGMALALQGRFVAAHALQSEAATELRKLLGPDAYQNALIAIRRAQTFTRQGDARGAAEQFREALRLFEKTYGRDHFGHFDWSLALAEALSKFDGGHAEAATITEDLLARWTGRPEVASRYVDLVLFHCDLHPNDGSAATRQTWARSALARADLQATVEQRRALQHCAR